MEHAFLTWLRDHLPPHPCLRLGPGDDAAVLRAAGDADTVVTVDLVSDGVDFRLDEIDSRRAGRKALAVNLSDLAAMAARPLAAVVALLLPREGAAGRDALQLAIELYEGMLPLAERYDLAIAGGDTNTGDGPLAVAVTLLGQVTPRGPLRRDGALPGDWLLVTGAFGGSILGHHLDFEPRVEEALLLNDRYTLHAGMDVSDGLALDLSRMCAASGCGATIRDADVPIAPAAAQLASQLADGSTPLDHALADGEDFELLLAVPPEEARELLADQPLEVPLTAVGELSADPGLWRQDGNGARQPLDVHGYEH